MYLQGFRSFTRFAYSNIPHPQSRTVSEFKRGFERELKGKYQRRRTEMKRGTAD
jgi:hypothetical protein